MCCWVWEEEEEDDVKDVFETICQWNDIWLETGNKKDLIRLPIQWCKKMGNTKSGTNVGAHLNQRFDWIYKWGKREECCCSFTFTKNIKSGPK